MLGWRAKDYLRNEKWQGVILVGVGLFSSVAGQYVPGAISHIFFLLKYLMFVGVFYCLYSNIPNKRLIMVVVFGLLIVRSISAGMFGELVFMGAMSMILLLLGTKVSFPFKLGFVALGIFSILVIQSIKPAFRKQTWIQKNENKLEIFGGLAMEKITDPASMFENDIMLFGFVARFNQGQVISRVLKAVPDRYPYANGETIYSSLAASVVPRFLWPDKPEAGGAFNFKRFLGVTLRGYSIGLSPFGEAWGNFGKSGGVAFMFFFGLLFNFFFSLILKLSLSLPSLILWTPYFFFYACQIESDVVTMLNSFTKAAIFAFIFIKIFPLAFKLKV